MKNFNKGKFLTSLVIVLLLAITVGVVYVAVSNEVDKYKRNWDAIQFAMREPDLVRALSTDYASKSAELKNSYIEKDLKPSEQLIDQINKKLESSSLK